MITRYPEYTPFKKRKLVKMQGRFVSIWFRYFKTDCFVRRQKNLKDVPVALVAAERGRMIITAANSGAEKEGVYPSMPLADAKALIPSLQYFDDEPERFGKALQMLAAWMIRYTPVTGIDPPTGLLLDATGCAHLWQGEFQYLTAIYNRLQALGYQVRIAMAHSIGMAWAVARFGKDDITVIEPGDTAALLLLPPAALRLETTITERLEKLGLRQISQFINMQRTALRRRFGTQLLLRLDQALGLAHEIVLPLEPVEPFHERLSCIEPIITATGIEIAIKRLLDSLCKRLQQEEMGLRVARLTCYRLDGRSQQVKVGTIRPSSNSNHLYKLFELKIETIAPAPGIELFVLDATSVETNSAKQENLWKDAGGSQQVDMADLLDRISSKMGEHCIHRYMPAAHYWPERSFQRANKLDEVLTAIWKLDRPRPIQLLSKPVLIEVTAPIPDYPPMNFRYKGKVHKIINADGPERIEQEWWIQEGQHRDYYYVEDDEGHRYWLFRSGHYDEQKTYKWFIHGFFQ